MGHYHSTFFRVLGLPLATLLGLIFCGGVFPVAAAGQVQLPGIEWSFVRADEKIPIGSETVKESEYDENKEVFNVYRPSKGRLYKESKLYRDTEGTDRKVWDIFDQQIAGAKFANKYLGAFATYSVPNEPILGFVQKIKGVYSVRPTWGLALNVHGADFSNAKWLRDVVIVLIHEHAHLLTLNEKQIEYLPPGKLCSRIHKGIGYIVSSKRCSKSDSYLNHFIQQFWSEEQIKTVARLAAFGVVESFYQSHQSDFVTEYAVSSPLEDIAESFTDFILRSKPTSSGLVRDQKILFFYEYPELVTLRSEMRERIQKYF